MHPHTHTHNIPKVIILFLFRQTEMEDELVLKQTKKEPSQYPLSYM